VKPEDVKLGTKHYSLCGISVVMDLYCPARNRDYGHEPMALADRPHQSHNRVHIGFQLQPESATLPRPPIILFLYFSCNSIYTRVCNAIIPQD
jgi:hypothetical protein